MIYFIVPLYLFIDNAFSLHYPIKAIDFAPIIILPTQLNFYYHARNHPNELAIVEPLKKATKPPIHNLISQTSIKRRCFHTFTSTIPPRFVFVQTTFTIAQTHHFVNHPTAPIIPTLIYEYATPTHDNAICKTLSHQQTILDLH